MTFKSIAAATGSLCEQVGRSDLAMRVETNHSDWNANIDENNILTLWHEPSNTFSAMVIGIDGIAEPNTFYFLGHKKGRLEAREPVPQEHVWEARHRRFLRI